MKTTLLTTASDPNHPGWLQFKRSLDHFGWDYHLIVHEYTGYNSKIVAFYEYLVEHPEITHFIYADSYDSFALSTQKEAEDKFTNWHGLMYGVEKACWPYEDWASEYPESPYPHRYLNGGGFMGSSLAFVRMYESNPISESGWDNDQIWAQNEYLRRNDDTIKLDRECNIFQPTAHRGIEDFAILNLKDIKRVLNLHTMSAPILLHQNGKSDGQWIWDLLPEKVKLNTNMNLTDLKKSWVDEPDYHKEIHERLTYLVNDDIELGIHRQWVRKNIFGFGEDSFHWVWKLLVDEMGREFKFCEIGCFRFQIVSLIRLLANRTGKSVERICITPLSNAGGMWDSDYAKDAETIHDYFNLVKDYKIIKEFSTSDTAVLSAQKEAPFDLLYIDGSHTFSDALFDLTNYSPLVKSGGYLVIDDAACRTKQPFGYFQGIDTVCAALADWEKTDIAKNFEFQFNVVHLMIYKRI